MIEEAVCRDRGGVCPRPGGENLLLNERGWSLVFLAPDLVADIIKRK